MVIPFNNPRPATVTVKIFPRSGEMPLLSTSVVPGGLGNADYFDATVCWGFGIGKALANHLYVYYRDVIDMLYDGYEPKH